jgi:hypothetical protein
MSTETIEAAPAAPARLSNVELGELIGLSHSSASRVRAGHRAPGYRVMLAIERVFGWPFKDQIAVLDRSRVKYGETLESHVEAWRQRRDA